jgi:hypothetical protein
MKKQMKQALAIILSAVMMFYLLPTTVALAGGESGDDSDIKAGVITGVATSTDAEKNLGENLFGGATARLMIPWMRTS